MPVNMIVLLCLVTGLVLLNVYQYLIQRAALRIAEILYVMARNVRAKAVEVRRDGKDVEIIEAHLFDMATSARSIGWAFESASMLAITVPNSLPSGAP